MLDRHFLEAFLKLNNTSEQMTEGEVRSVLTAAGWSEGEVAAALNILQQKGDQPTPEETQELSPHHFRPDFEFSSNQLSHLLGVDVQLDPEAISQERTLAPSREEIVFKMMVGCAVVCVSLGVVAAVGLWAVYAVGVDISPLVDLF